MDVNKNITQRQIAESWYNFLIEKLDRNRNELGIGITGKLKQSFVRHLIYGGNGELSSIKISFEMYGAFVDMGVGKGQKVESVKENRNQWSKILGEQSKRAPKKWLSKTVYSESLKLMDLLSEHYQERSWIVFKEQFESQKNTVKINL